MRIRTITVSTLALLALAGCSAHSATSHPSVTAAPSAPDPLLPDVGATATGPLSGPTSDPMSDDSDDTQTDPPRYTDGEQAYLDTVGTEFDRSGYTDAEIVAFGHRACTMIGNLGMARAGQKAGRILHIPAFDGGYVVGAASTTICPEDR